MLPKWFTPIVVATVAGLSVWLLSEQAPKKPRLTALNNTVPDVFMENFTTHILDEMGKPRHIIRAKHMAHYPFDNHSEFTSPLFTIYQPENRQWEVSAKQGITKDGTETIILQGDVIMSHRQTSSSEPDLKIHTNELLIHPDKSYLETDQIITITKGKHSLQSTGMKAYLDEGRVELLSRVRGVYAL